MPAAVTLVGCPAPVDESAIFVEDFESRCEGTPCGWAQVAGPDEGARYVETLPGDHGLELVGDGVVVRGGIDEPSQRTMSGHLTVRAHARCDLGSHLEVRVTLEVSGADPITYEAELVPDDTWRLLGDQTLRVLDPQPPPWQITRVLGVSIRKNGARGCEIDYLAIRTARSF